MAAKEKPTSNRGEIARLAKQIADHQARIQVIAANWGEEINSLLTASERQFLSKLAKMLKDFEFHPNALKTLSDLRKICRELNAIRQAAYVRAEKKITAEAGALAENEAKWAKRVTKELSEPGTKFADATPAALDKVVKFGLANGVTLSEYFSKVAADDAARIESTIRQGVESGWTIDQMARNIAGTAANDYKDGIFETSRRSAVNMARTLTNAIANNAKETFYRENSDVLEGVEILATLDGRTCPVCASIDRKRYKFDEQHPSLPIHHQCRCVLLPVTPLSDLVEESRPMAKADFMKEAERLYKKKYPNKDFAALADSTKKKYYYEAMREYERITGEPAYTQVSGGVSFRDYFENHMTAQQQRDWLGPQRYKLWQHGNLPLDKFIPPYPNPKLTIEVLKDLDKKSFAQKSPVIAMQRTKTLTHEEVEAVLQYTRSDDYADLNSYLRTGQSGNAYFDNEIKLLNSAINKTQITEDITVWRGIKSMDVKKIAEKTKTHDITAFTSTSTSKEIAEKFAGVGDDAVIYKISIPKGTHAIDAMGISRKPEEAEILLPPTGIFKQKGVYYDEVSKRQIVEVVYEQ